MGSIGWISAKKKKSALLSSQFSAQPFSWILRKIKKFSIEGKLLDRICSSLYHRLPYPWTLKCPTNYHFESWDCSAIVQKLPIAAGEQPYVVNQKYWKRYFEAKNHTQNYSYDQWGYKSGIKISFCFEIIAKNPLFLPPGRKRFLAIRI